MKKFLKDGGNLLIATDRRLNRRDLGFHITGIIVRAPDVQHDHAYHGEILCPKVNSVMAGGQKWLPEGKFEGHPIFHFLGKEIATNCPSNIEVFDNEQPLQDLLVYRFGLPRLEGGIYRGGLQRYVVGSPKDAPPSGRALYIAGHGMFMNSTMLQTDNDNFQFTVNIVRWLRESEGKSKRTKTLLIIDGEIITDFDMKLTPPLPPIPMPPLKIIGRLIREFEKERGFHRLLGEIMGSRAGVIVAILFAIVTLIVLIYGAKKFMEGRSHVETNVPSMIGTAPPMSSTAPAEQRQQALLRQTDYWEESRFLVLQWFRQELDVTPHHWRPEVDASFHISAWSSWALQSKADYVLRFARDAEPIRVSRHEFFRLLENLKELSGALQDGRLALLVEGKNVRQSQDI